MQADTRKQLELREYLADSDVPCPKCCRNLRGVRTGSCPACLCPLRLNDVKSWHIVYGDSDELPMPPPTDRFDDWFLEYIQGHDEDCAGCGYSLRGIRQMQCPECGIYIERDAVMKTIDQWRVAEDEKPLVELRPGCLWVILVVVAVIFVVLSLL